MKKISLVIASGMLASMVYATGVIDIAYSPYTISNPGSYLVVKNLTTAQGFDGIDINTSDVTIDLNGHTLYGPGTTGVNFGSGIVSDAGDNITITNGVIHNFNGVGIYLGMAQAHISKMKIIGCNGQGIYVDGGVIENNLISKNGYNGIDCQNTVYPAVIANNVVSYNNTTLTSNPAIFVYNNCDITGNNISNNYDVGIDVHTGDCRISGNTLNGNYFIGIDAGNNCTITGNNVTHTLNGPGIYAFEGCNVIGNTVAGNSTEGIFADSGCRVSDNEVYNNIGSGINAYTGCTLTGNHVYGNTNAAGISIGLGSNTIQNNSMFSNTTGLWISGSGNFFAGNILRSNTVETTIASGNTAGNGTTGFTNIVVP